MQAIGDCLIVASEVLAFVATAEIFLGEGFKSDEDAAQAGFGGFFDEVSAEDGIDSCSTLKEAAHTFHSGENGFREVTIAEEMVVEEVEMTAGQPFDLSESFVDTLRVKAAAALEEGILVAEVAMLGTTAGDNDGVGNEVGGAADEIAANRWNALKRAARC